MFVSESMKKFHSRDTIIKYKASDIWQSGDSLGEKRFKLSHDHLCPFWTQLHFWILIWGEKIYIYKFLVEIYLKFNLDEIVFETNVLAPDITEVLYVCR